MNPGKFITIEGIEGVGKSTNIEFIKKLLEKNNIEVLTTREPGGTALAENIRNILLTKNNSEQIYPETELLLIFAARKQHLENKIIPALRQGQWVLCDRFTDATYAYQGGGRGLNMQHISYLEQLVQNDFRPDITIILDAAADLGLDRAGKRSEADRFEAEKVEFFIKVRESYLQRAKQQPEKYIIIDASQSLAKVQSAITDSINQWLP